MINVLKTDDFAAWLDRLADRKAAARITVRIRRLELGNPGKTIVVLLTGGNKSSQDRDIKAARALAEQVKGML